MPVWLGRVAVALAAAGTTIGIDLLDNVFLEHVENWVFIALMGLAVVCLTVQNLHQMKKEALHVGGDDPTFGVLSRNTHAARWIAVGAGIALVPVVLLAVLSGQAAPAPTATAHTRQSAAVSLPATATTAMTATDVTIATTPAAPAANHPVQQRVNGGDVASISCTNSSFCLAGDPAGNIYRRYASGWESITSIGSLTSISCAAEDFCALTTATDRAYLYSGGGWSFSDLVGADGQPANLKSVSCPAAGFCVAVGSWDTYIYSNGRWAQGSLVQDQARFTSISCSDVKFCMITASDGQAYADVPDSGITGQHVSANSLTTVSCSNPGFCVAIGSDKRAYAWTSQTWSPVSLLAASGDAADVVSVSCRQAGSCAAVGGSEIVSESGGTWAKGVVVQGASNFESISCGSGDTCVSGDSLGFAYEVPIR